MGRGLNLLACTIVSTAVTLCAPSQAQAAAPLAPLVSENHPVEWWFAYKFNVGTLPTNPIDRRRDCIFGGKTQPYSTGFSQSYVVASSDAPELQLGKGLLGVSKDDPLGATFGRVYRGEYSYVVFNDQFYDDPQLSHCSKFCGAPWAHSKGLIAWNDDGEGLVLQVTTPSWPGSGNNRAPRAHDGNTLGCVDDNNVKVAQHFFALHLDRSDTLLVLKGMVNAGVPTDPGISQIVHIRTQGPKEFGAVVAQFGDASPPLAALSKVTLSRGVQLISKPSSLHVAPWLLVSAALGGEPLRVASWWTGNDALPSTKAVIPGCWADGLGTPGRVEMAITGTWAQKPIGLAGGNNPNGNHAKLAVSLPPGHRYTIFGDMNQTGGLAARCGESQNPRGGLFFVVKEPELHRSIAAFLAGTTAADGTATVAEGAARWKPALVSPSPELRRRLRRSHR